MKIGIPRALYFFKYGSLWEQFFKKLGCQLVISPPTNKKILTNGVDIAVEEACIPLKVFYGHCKSLKGKCDFVFIPRYISVMPGTYTCPKFLVLPDVARFLLPDLPILTVSIKGKKQPGMLQLTLLGVRIVRKMGKRCLSECGSFFNIVRMYRLLRVIQKKEEEKRDSERNFHFLLNKDNLKIMVVGHPYNLKDPYVNRDLLEKLAGMGATVFTSSQVPLSLIRQELEGLPFIYWSEEQEIAGSAYFALREPRIQGIVLVSSFGCGPDSLITEQIIKDGRKFSKPLMQVLLDENISDVNIQTRLEAFLDMLERRK